MMYKKYSYLIVLILSIIFGSNTVFAGSKVCYYMEPEGVERPLRAKVTIKWGISVPKEYCGGISVKWGRDLSYAGGIEIDNVGGVLAQGYTPILNWGNFFNCGSGKDCAGCDHKGSDDSTTAGLHFGYKYYSLSDFEHSSEPACPKYVVVERNGDGDFLWWSGDENWGWVTDDLSKAQQAYNTKYDNAGWAYASNFTTINGKQVQITETIYKNRWVHDSDVEIDKTPLDCDSIFTADIKDLINEILTIPRILIPIVIILLGVIDFAKAAIANKEDTMKKAQMDFVKRVIIGVAIFFVPTLVNLVMDLGNIVWDGLGYSSCNIV